MTEFLRALADPDMAFLRSALLLGLIGSVPLGAVGTFVVARRISYLAAAIAHSVLGGIGLAVYLRQTAGWEWLSPMAGALAAALGAAGLVGWIALRARQREDAAIGAVWVLGMAVGLLCLSRTPGYVDPMAYLFGDILLVTRGDLWAAGAVAFVVSAVVLIWHRQIAAVCFDPEFAAIRGIPADGIHFLLLGLAALTVVLMVSLVGVVLVVALLTLPPAIAALRSRGLGGMLLAAVCLNLLFVVVGLGASYSLDLPTGPTVILVAATVFFAALGLARPRGPAG